ncbi:uncharacterized protein LOC117323416 [Pecten maximus]|uniref:uncharacterized protein LOC117323416 n=1 Tax=Pecten maximus TaxID=6579 RepID=UPI00145893DC|nr:uncharacterized protein LOC117323416 [Pecten maximus]XP_033734518.1 uncharacterized protein LOC117323416 [Pecten maximus]XP_033734519.1 uncharacterized protein LOC117323416 [Pecten maximus]
MPMVKLVSAQPVAFGKNALLQKRYENQCSHLVHDHRANQRKIQGAEEQCVISAYSLLMEAEKFEREKIDRGEIKYDSSTGRYSTTPAQGKSRRHIQKVRPLTAAGHGTSTPRVSVDNKRPSTASASLGKQSASVISMIEIDNEPTVESQMTKERRNTPLANTPRSAVQQPQTENVNNTEMQSNSHSQRTSDLHVIIPKHPASTQNTVRLHPSSIRPKDRDSRLLTDRSNSRTSSRLSSIQEVRESDKGLHNGKTCRPRTADDFRRKCDENEMTTYWNRRVTKLIKRWNLEDISDPFLTNESMPYSDEIGGHPQEPPSPILEPPTRSIEPDTDASLKTKKFIQTYGSHFRSLLRPNSAPSVTESKNRRRPVKVTRQELNSIKADISRRRKQTNAILKKSKRIRNHIQTLADWKYEG